MTLVMHLCNYAIAIPQLLSDRWCLNRVSYCIAYYIISDSFLCMPNISIYSLIILLPPLCFYPSNRVLIAFNILTMVCISNYLISLSLSIFSSASDWLSSSHLIYWHSSLAYADILHNNFVIQTHPYFDNKCTYNFCIMPMHIFNVYNWMYFLSTSDILLSYFYLV